jgi:phosphate:Na+ symporter
MSFHRIPRTTALLAVTLVLAWFWAPAALAQNGAKAPEIDWPHLLTAVTGGLALFLFGVTELAGGLRAAAGERVETLLGHATDGPVRGLATGVAATTVLDSSSVTIILLIGLVDAGLVGFAQALPVILGSNIGTTVSSQVFALGVEDYAPLILAAGLLVRAFGAPPVKNWGAVVAGIGLVLFGLNLIGEAVAPLKDHPPVVEWLKSAGTPLRGVLIGAVFTLVIQSSSATLGVIIALASQGVIDLPSGLAMMLGAEIGTCSDTLVATAGRSRAAVRAGLFHLGFNLVTVAVGVALIGPLAGFAAWSSDRLEQQIANAHVFFNVAGAVVFLGLVPAIARGLERLVPDRRTARTAPAPST